MSGLDPLVRARRSSGHCRLHCRDRSRDGGAQAQHWQASTPAATRRCTRPCRLMASLCHSRRDRRTLVRSPPSWPVARSTSPRPGPALRTQHGHGRPGHCAACRAAHRRPRLHRRQRARTSASPPHRLPPPPQPPCRGYRAGQSRRRPPSSDCSFCTRPPRAGRTRRCRTRLLCLARSRSLAAPPALGACTWARGRAHPRLPLLLRRRASRPTPGATCAPLPMRSLSSAARGAAAAHKGRACPLPRGVPRPPRSQCRTAPVRLRPRPAAAALLRDGRIRTHKRT
jgi:hypothetical protein